MTCAFSTVYYVHPVMYKYIYITLNALGSHLILQGSLHIAQKIPELHKIVKEKSNFLLKLFEDLFL